MKSLLAAVVVFSHATLAPLAAAAQGPPARGEAFTGGDGGILAAGLAAGALLISADKSIADQVRASSLHDNDLVRGTMGVARVYGDPGSLVLSAGLWAAGAARDDRTMRLVGTRAFESVVASGVVTGAIKMLAGRARPDASPADAERFAFARGLRDGGAYQSFPSGHTTAAFAFASAVDGEWARLDPKRPRWVVPALYGLAALTGVSRVFDDKHWTSDVVVGAAIGYVSGRAITRWHNDPR